ncbi:MAG: adenylate/guanylate cyclase domain-containing protein, partial [Candidatus Promineifilaceae bacterium]|nr:adenylate/guanylate cyclase domain-containing protein [Candidatus Promineifilaceae bacterium]
MSKREDLVEAIATVEAQRALLGDEAVDAVLDGLRRELAELAVIESQILPPAEAQTTGGERRIVTVLFCDVTGSTKLAETLDPEVWTEIMDEALDYLIEPVDRFDGTVARLTGESILAFFGAPKAHEDDPQRAVEASLAILRNIQPFRRTVKRERGLDFNVRVGINTGLVVTGRVGSKVHDEYTALGDAANIAARMEQTAAPGTIQISEKTYRLVASQFDCVPLGEIPVKGKSKPVPAYRVLGRSSQAERVGGSVKEIRSVMVGRESEFSKARDAITQLLQGTGGVLFIVGQAGVGKSRLAAEVRQDSPLESLNWLEGRTLSYGQNISYWPFQDIIWSYASIYEEDSEEQAWQKLKTAVENNFGAESIDILPFLSRLISLEARDEYAERIRHLDGEAMGHQIYLAARRFFERLALNRPTALVFEDVHWIDESSAALLEHILPLFARLPILFIITSRPYHDAPLELLRRAVSEEHEAQFTELFLQPLTQQESAQLAQNLLNVGQMPADVQRMIIGKASGNPFFLEEILRSLIDTGGVVYDPVSDRWQATTQIRNLAIPDNVQGLIMARVDRLDHDVRRVLQAAAVIGRSFFFRVLEAMDFVDAALDRYLADLENAELIRKKQLLPELEYIFNHALVQETTYEAMLFRKRRELHARVGQAIEEIFADRLEEFYGVLAYHYARAEEWEKAQEYLFKAGDQAGQVAADAEALAHYQQALAAYERVFGASWDPVQRAVLARKMGEAYFRRGEHDQALDQFQAAFKLLGQPPVPEPHLPTILAIGRELLSQLMHRLLPGTFVKESSDEVSLAVQETARIHNLLGWIFLFSERERFLWASVRRLNFAETSGYRPAAAAGGAAFAVVWDLLPKMSWAEGYHSRAVALAEASGNANALGITYQGMGFHRLHLGYFEQSLDCVRRSEKVLRQAGDLHGLGNALSMIAFNHIHQGFLLESLPYVEELISTGEDGADPQLVCWGSIGRGIVRNRLGLLEEAATDFEEGLHLASILPDHYWHILGQAFYGQCLLWQEKLDEAFAALDEGERVYQKRGIGGPTLYHLRANQAEAHLFAAAHDDGQRAAHLKQANRASKTAFKLSRQYRLFRAEAYRLSGTVQWMQGKIDRA